MAHLASRITVILLALLLSATQIAGIGQRFIASPKNPSLKRTTTNFEPSYDFQKIVYYDEPDPQQESGIELAASILLEPKYPLLIHEDIDYAIRRIQCTEEEMSILFEGYDYMKMAHDTWSATEEFVIVTYARSCANPGEHAAYLFDSARYLGYRLQLRGNKTTLRAVTHRMYVDMGAHVIPQVDTGKWKRQQMSLTDVQTVVVLTTVDAGDSSTLAQETSVETTTDAANTAGSTPESSANGYSATATLPDPSPESFTFVYPTASPTGGSASSDISFSEVDLVLMPPSQEIIDSGISPNTIEDVQLKCLNCTGTGQISFSSAGFTMSGDQIDDARNFLDNGYIEFDAAGLSAYMHLQLQLQPGFSLLSFENNLRRKQLGSIEIANVIVIEPFIDFGVPIGVTLQSTITIESGFTFSNPDTAKIVLNMSELSSSYTSGFENSAFNALPFDANAPDLSFELSIAYKPKLSVNLGLTESAKNETDGDFDISGGLGVYVEIPNLKFDISERHNVDGNCQPSSDQNSAVEVAPGIEFTAGYTADFEVSGLIDLDMPDDDGVFFSTSVGFSSTCLIWDANILGFVNPSATSSLASASGTGALSASLASVSASNALASASGALATAAGGPGSASAASAVASASSAVAAASSASASVAHENVASRPQMEQSWSAWSLFGLLLSCFFDV